VVRSGLGGQFIVGHRGLDLVLAIKNSPGGPADLWSAVHPALVALEPAICRRRADLLRRVRARRGGMEIEASALRMEPAAGGTGPPGRIGAHRITRAPARGPVAIRPSTAASWISA
jgi:hypothetical protein